MKRSAMPKVSKDPERRMEMRADRLWSQAVKHLARYRCAVCSKRADHSHHLLTRSNKVLRHEWMNGLALCVLHHNWAHARPNEFSAFMKAKKPSLCGIYKRKWELMTVKYEELLKNKIVELERILDGKVNY